MNIKTLNTAAWVAATEASLRDDIRSLDATRAYTVEQLVGRAIAGRRRLRKPVG